MNNNRFDVVVVGGGSAGAVLANRLSENPSRTILLLEAGAAYQFDEYPDVLLNPARVGGDEQHDWGFQAKVGAVGSLDREIDAPRGKALGGSSAVNAAVAPRARPSDFAAWTAHGLSNWSFDDVLPTYRELENTESRDDRFHGRSGPFPIRQRTYDELTPSLKAFIGASSSQGFARIDDPNADKQDVRRWQPADLLVLGGCGSVYSGKHCPTGLNVQVVTDPGRRLYVSETVTGKTHDGGPV